MRRQEKNPPVRSMEQRSISGMRRFTLCRLGQPADPEHLQIHLSDRHSIVAKALLCGAWCSLRCLHHARWCRQLSPSGAGVRGK